MIDFACRVLGAFFEKKIIELSLEMINGIIVGGGVESQGKEIAWTNDREVCEEMACFEKWAGN